MPKYNPKQLDILPGNLNFQDSDGLLTSLPLNEATLRKFGIENDWTNALWAPMEKDISEQEESKLRELSQVSCATGHKIAITPMLPPLLGYEAIAIQDIIKGECLIYSGDLAPYPSDGSLLQDDYGFDNESREGYCVGNRYYLSAKYSGNYARFMSSAPHEENLDSEYVFTSQTIKRQVATANFTTCAIEIGKGTHGNTLFFCYLQAKRNIKCGEKLYIDYGKFLGNNFVLFNKNGKEFIDRRVYGLKGSFNPDYNYAMSVKENCIASAKRIYPEGDWKGGLKDVVPHIWFESPNIDTKEPPLFLIKLKQHIEANMKNEIEIQVSRNTKTQVWTFMIKSALSITQQKIPVFNVRLAVSTTAVIQIGLLSPDSRIETLNSAVPESRIKQSALYP